MSCTVAAQRNQSPRCRGMGHLGATEELQRVVALTKLKS